MNAVFGVDVALSPEEKIALRRQSHYRNRSCPSHVRPGCPLSQLASRAFSPSPRVAQSRTVVLPDAEIRKVSYGATRRCRRCCGARVGLSQFDEADEGTFIAGLGGKGVLAHLQPQPMLPQQLTERCGRIKFRIVLYRRRHTSLWHRKYITRCV